MTDFSVLAADMGDLAEDKVLTAVRNLVQNEPEHIQQAIDALSEGMEIVGERFEFLEYFVGDLIFAGEVFTSAMERTIRALQVAGLRDKASVVIGGAGVSERTAKEIGADAYCHAPEDTVAFCVTVDEKRVSEKDR